MPTKSTAGPGRKVGRGHGKVKPSGSKKANGAQKERKATGGSCSAVPVSQADMGWLIDLRESKEALEAALADPVRSAGALKQAVEAGRAASAAAPTEAVEIADQVEALLAAAARKLSIRELSAGGPWAMPVAQLQMAIERAVELGKTPLVVDNAAESAGSYLRYQSVVTIDGKELVARKATKDATVVELRAECRAKLVTAMTCGYPLYFDCSTAAPDFVGTFCGESFPREVFETIHHDGFNGKDSTGYHGSAVNCSTFDDRLASGADLHELQRSRAIGRSVGCHPIIRTSFELDDYAEFLRFGEFLPDATTFQVIVLGG